MKEKIKKRREKKNSFDCNNYQKLLLAILKEAWCDVFITPTADKLKYITDYEYYSKSRAYEFMSGIKTTDNNEEKDELYTMEEMFNLCCNNLGIEPSYFRKLFFHCEKYFIKQQETKPDKIFNFMMKKMIGNF